MSMTRSPRLRFLARLKTGAAALGAPLLAVALLGAVPGCPTGPKTVIIKGPVVQPVAEARWRTMRAEHRVQIDAAKGDGREQTSVRGLIAVERPDRFRLRALGPGGITLFDILKVGGDVKIVQGMASQDSSLQQKVLLSIGADLAAAYDLEPKLPSRTKDVGLKEGEVRVVEPERAIRLQQYKEVQGQSVPTHMEIQNNALDYKVSVDVESATLDEKLDPGLFRAGS
jgi:hypothetical protein